MQVTLMRGDTHRKPGPGLCPQLYDQLRMFKALKVASPCGPLGEHYFINALHCWNLYLENQHIWCLDTTGFLEIKGFCHALKIGFHNFEK